MNDLEHDLHAYIEAAFARAAAEAPAFDGVSLLTPGTGSGLEQRRGLRNGLIAVGVALSVAALAVLLLWLSSDSQTDKHIPAADSPPAEVKATGPADCAGATGVGDTTLLAVTVTGEHTICITQNGDKTLLFVDGIGGVNTTGLTPLGEGTWSGGGARGSDGSFFDIANLLNNASALRLTFCDGTTLDLHPLNDTNPRFVAATFDPTAVGVPALQQLDELGNAIGNAHDPSPPGGKGICTAR